MKTKNNNVSRKEINSIIIKTTRNENEQKNKFNEQCYFKII